MSEPMTLTVTAYCDNCGKIQPLDRHGRCSVCNSDSVDYRKPRDARTALAKHLYEQMKKIRA